jgi:preprotein translocase subunit SecG
LTLPSVATLSALTISLGTANLLAYLMLVVVAIFLIAGPVIVYIYYQKSRKERAAAQPSSA